MPFLKQPILAARGFGHDFGTGLGGFAVIFLRALAQAATRAESHAAPTAAGISVTHN
jgi:hypothetical protein